MTRRVDTVAKTPGVEAKWSSWTRDSRRLKPSSIESINPLKKILSEESRRRKAKCTMKPFSPSTLPKYCPCMLSLSHSLNLKKEERKE